ncbi:MAG: GNAT family N-acetyltransferase [Anaerolineales bacterium]|nr:GNAT family N-acetyltransferase [Anaerolineales bacterium]
MRASLVAIEQATWRDLFGVVALEKLCFGREAWPWIDYLAALTLPETVPLKAVLDGQLVGFVAGDRRRKKNLGWIATLGVHPDFQRRGIGSMLLKVCENELAMPRIRLTLRRSNQAAMRLYERSGYLEVDVWSRYYSNGEDGVVMEKVI